MEHTPGLETSPPPGSDTLEVEGGVEARPANMARAEKGLSRKAILERIGRVHTRLGRRGERWVKRLMTRNLSRI